MAAGISVRHLVAKCIAKCVGVVAVASADDDGDGIDHRLDLGFAGQIRDVETSLFYNMNRYYDPVMGRYTQSDPIGLV